MSKLTALKDKDSKEVLKLLSAVSSSLLPNPGVGDSLNASDTGSELVQAIVAEIRERLQLPTEDTSAKTQARIYAFISEEISKAALANVDIRALRARLGGKGELRPNQYQIEFSKDFLACEALGIRKSHVEDALRQPDYVTHLRAKYVSQDPLITISVKSIVTQRSEDRFLLLVISNRIGQVQQAFAAFRAYYSEVDLNNVTEALDVVRAFAKTYGLTFRLSESVSKCMVNEVVRRERDAWIFSKGGTEHEELELLEGQPGAYYLPLIMHGTSNFRGAGGEVLAEVFLAFVVNVNDYVAALQKHHVHLKRDIEWRFPII